MEELTKNLEEKIKSGYQMMEKLKPLSEKVEGSDKLSRKINQEVKFLNKVRSTGNVKKEYLQSTNLIHLNAIIERLVISKDAVSVMRPFKFENSRLEVDIVCDSGSSWVKVIARNPRALTLISQGEGEFGQKSVVDQAQAYLSCAELHPHRYKAPEVVFHFACGIENSLAVRLEELGVVVEGVRIGSLDPFDRKKKLMTSPTTLIKKIKSPEANNNNYDTTIKRNLSNDKTCQKKAHLLCQGDIKTLNLDVSTLLAYVSNMTNGHANFDYLEPLLSLQAEWERLRPVKPVLDKIFQGKKLIICETAYKNLMDIINIIGGANETARTKELIKRVTIVDDATEGRILDLALGGKIKNRSRIVFATGEMHKSITVSANEGFVRAAKMQGIECTVILHEPRSLSEIKEKYAQELKS
ncbi:GSCOCG00004688001-RA-CDS [Cotesia congregata]|nr:GSCOCG00004688001-RA-CDS [Cotesia congregata]